MSATIKKISVGKSQVGLVDHSDYVIKQFQGALGDASKVIAGMAVEAVQSKMLYGYHDVHGLPDNPHTEILDTGTLFDSITASIVRVSQNTFTVSVGTTVPYAIYVHEGTSKLKGRPFITDAMAESSKSIESAIVRTLRNKMRGK